MIPSAAAPNVTLEIAGAETLAVRFPYQKSIIELLRLLSHRRWDADARCWMVHLSHLPELARIFRLPKSQIAPEILHAYERAAWKESRVRVELGPVELKLSGSQIPWSALDRETSFMIPGAEFSPKFIARQWDGRRHLIDRKRQTMPSGLWPRARRVFEAEGVQFEIGPDSNLGQSKHDLPKPLPFGESRTPLRAYQTAALEAALAAKRGIIQIATGGGKTLLAAHLIRRIAQPAFFFVHTLDLMYQTARVFERELGVPIGLLGDGQAELAPITVATVQTAMRAFVNTRYTRKSKINAAGSLDDAESGAEEHDAEGPDERQVKLTASGWLEVRAAIERAHVVIFDECHHVPADTFYKIAMRTPAAAYRIGLSATPWRDDHNDLLLEAALGEKLHVTTCSDLVDAGYLIAPRIRMRPAPAPPRLPRRIPYHECYQRAIVENRERNRAIAAQAQAWAAQGSSVLVLVAHVAHGRALLELMPEAQFVHGASDAAERQHRLEQLERKLHPILVATTLADEGLDVPSLGAVILAGGGKSATRAYQRIGRVLRPAPGKTEAQVLDFWDSVPYLRDHSEARLALYRQEPRFIVSVGTGA